MKYIKLFEKFTKDYMKKIDLKDFKKIKKGSKILYMGGQVEVLDNNGYVLKLKGEDGRTFTVNKSQFDHGGMIKEVSDGKKKKKKKEFHPDMMYEAKAPDADKAMRDLKRKGSEINWLDDADDDTKKIWKKAGVNPEDENTVILYSYVSHQWDDAKKILKKHNVDFKELEDPNSAGESFIVFVQESVNELRTSPVSGTKAGFTTSLEDRKYELKKDVKGAKIGSFANVTLPKGTIIYNLPGGVFADHFSLKNKYASRSSQGPQYFDKPTFKGIMITSMPDTLAAIEKNSKVLESLNELSSAQDGTKDSDGKHKHEHHLEEDIEAMWKKAYGENFSSQYPAVAKIIKQRKIKDKREIARIWQDTYDEDFEKEYPALFQKLS